MSEIQVVTKEVKSLRATMEAMEVGQFFTEDMTHEGVLRSYASLFKKMVGKKYVVKRDADGLIITRTA